MYITIKDDTVNRMSSNNVDKLTISISAFYPL